MMSWCEGLCSRGPTVSTLNQNAVNYKRRSLAAARELLEPGRSTQMLSKARPQRRQANLRLELGSVELPPLRVAQFFSLLTAHSLNRCLEFRVHYRFKRCV